MSVWTGAAQGLNQFLAQREVERQRALVEQIANEDRVYARSRDEKADAREKERAALEAKRESRIDADRQAQLDEAAKAARYRNAATLRTTMQPGQLSPEAFAAMQEFNLDQGVTKKTPGVALKIARPSVQAQPEDIPTLPSQLDVSTPDQFESLGGTEFQEQARNEAARTAAATQAQAAAAEQKEADRQLREDLARDANATRATIAQTAAQGRGGITQTAESRLIDTQQRRWDELTKPAREVERQVGMMGVGLQAILDARAKGQNPGSQIIINTFNKILDPLSVVRESEYARTAEGQSFINRIEGGLQRIVRGGAGVANEELIAMVETARAMAKDYRAKLAPYRQRAEMMADRYQIPHELIFAESPAGTTSAAPAPGPAGPAAAPAAPGKRKYEIVSVK